MWTDLAPKLYAQAAAGQWDPATAVDWTPPQLPDEVEAAVVQVMTYLVENEQAALDRAGPLPRPDPPPLPGGRCSFSPPSWPTRPATSRCSPAGPGLGGRQLGVSGAGGRASLQTLLDEPDWPVASFLLSVLGEGTFLSLLSFLERHAPDPVTARIAHLALQDEARHVAFAMGHLGEHLRSRPRAPAAAGRGRAATPRRPGFDRRPVGHGPRRSRRPAAGEWSPEAIGRGWARVT